MRNSHVWTSGVLGKKLALLQKKISKPVENEYVHFNGVVTDDDDASLVGRKLGWSLSSFGAMTKQSVAELHYESSPARK